jgi:cytochrome b subunit of formate dehydrogenase
MTRMFTRFTLSRRIEHVVQILSFTTLVVTGCTQKFNSYRTAEAIIHAMGGIERVRGVHRFFGMVLIAEAVYHVGVVAFELLIRHQKTRMLFGPKDLRDTWHMLLYFVGWRADRPRFDRFDFRQKAEYWALVWGSVVMITTGLMMWFPVKTAALLPGEIIPAARAAHGGEGLLAFLAILIWHMYSAHLAPEVFPIDTCIFTGRISEERMRHEHPLEYERIVAAEQAQLEAEAEPEPEPDANGERVPTTSAPQEAASRQGQGGQDPPQSTPVSLPS